MKAREGEGVFASTPGTCRFLENKKPSTLTSKVLGSGDVLLSRGLSPYYHRGCSVSLPCSEWERVVPLRYCHQNSTPKFRRRILVSDKRRVTSDENSLARHLSPI